MLKQKPLQTVVARPTQVDQSQALRSIMGSAPQLSTEEQQKRKAQMKKIAEQQGEDALDTFLSEKLGLDF